MAFVPFTEGQVRILRSLPARDGNRLASALDLAGLTQTQFGAALGVPQGYVTNVVRGKTLPRLGRARDFAQFFGCAIEDLFPAKVEEVA